MASKVPKQPSTLAEQMLYSVAKITALKEGKVIGFGSGFYWSVPPIDGRHMQLLVTNKHVIEGADQVQVMAHLSPNLEERGPTGEYAQCEIHLDEVLVYHHPDPNIDLVGINFAGTIALSVEHGRPLYTVGLDERLLPNPEQWEQFDAIEEVVMVGCPKGIYDQHNISPISRRGISATPLANLYEGREEFLVDMACFPGSSGSPVFMLNRDGFLDRSTNSYRMGEGRFFFLGILYAGPTITNEGVVILNKQPTAHVATMMHLGQCIRSTKVLDIQALASAALQADLDARNAKSA